ncbi:M23 family metallopeptidase [Paenibacillus soyae]|uniref:M23 family metallopeptidase n=1 Tax=Paenibacillus soyae TaxID=2969249 RepID=UPI0027D464C5|nr:M23 family metallopeptidase [Paenibacillus soyae]
MNKRMKKLITASALLSLLVASPIASAATTYTVKSGDNLWKISTQYGTTIAELKALNGLTSDMLYVGQTLKLPTPDGFNSATVQAGDTMWKIAVRYSVPLNKLIAANPQIANPNNIWAGLSINIPKKPSAYLNGVHPLKAGTYTAYTSTYADGRSWNPDGTQARTHEGVDIFAKEGTPVYASMGGTVVKAGWNEYGGWRLTIRVDDNTEFYYAHMSKYASGMKEGVQVTAGQLIGYVGSTGYGPEGTSGKFLPHLHFGMYKRTPSYAPTNPYEYMKWWELG